MTQRGWEEMNDALNNARNILHELANSNYYVNVDEAEILMTYYVDDSAAKCRRTYIVLRSGVMIFVMKCGQDNTLYVSIESVHKSICSK